MTQQVERAWTATPPAPAVAAPLRAVDDWMCAREGGAWQVTARVLVDADDPQLRGHFPGQVVFPGVFVIESVVQAMACALTDAAAPPPVLREVRSIRFFAPLLDGDELTLCLTVQPRDEGGWSVAGDGIRQDGVIAARIRASFDPGTADDA